MNASIKRYLPLAVIAALVAGGVFISAGERLTGQAEPMAGGCGGQPPQANVSTEKQALYAGTQQRASLFDEATSSFNPNAFRIHSEYPQDIGDALDQFQATAIPRSKGISAKLGTCKYLDNGVTADPAVPAADVFCAKHKADGNTKFHVYDHSQQTWSGFLPRWDLSLVKSDVKNFTTRKVEDDLYIVQFKISSIAFKPDFKVYIKMLPGGPQVETYKTKGMGELAYGLAGIISYTPNDLSANPPVPSIENGEGAWHFSITPEGLNDNSIWGIQSCMNSAWTEFGAVVIAIDETGTKGICGHSGNITFGTISYFADRMVEKYNRMLHTNFQTVYIMGLGGRFAEWPLQQ